MSRGLIRVEEKRISKQWADTRRSPEGEIPRGFRKKKEGKMGEFVNSGDPIGDEVSVYYVKLDDITRFVFWPDKNGMKVLTIQFRNEDKVFQMSGEKATRMYQNLCQELRSRAEQRF